MIQVRHFRRLEKWNMVEALRTVNTINAIQGRVLMVENALMMKYLTGKPHM